MVVLVMYFVFAVCRYWVVVRQAKKRDAERFPKWTINPESPEQRAYRENYNKGVRNDSYLI